MRPMTCLAKQIRMIDSPCPVQETPPTSSVQYVPQPDFQIEIILRRKNTFD